MKQPIEVFIAKIKVAKRLKRTEVKHLQRKPRGRGATTAVERIAG